MRLDRIERDLETIKHAESPFRKYALQLITVVFLAGGGWVTIDKIDALAEENKEKVEKLEGEQRDDGERLIRIETKQEQTQDAIEEIKAEQAVQREKLDQILEELRRN